MNFDVLNDKLKDDIINAIKRTIGGFKGQKNNSQKWSLTHSFKNALIFTNEGGGLKENPHRKEYLKLIPSIEQYFKNN